MIVMSDKLKPCPFCGGEAEFDYFGEGDGDHQILCADLVCRGGIPLDEGFSTEEKAIINWNTRYTDTLKAELIEKIADKLIAGNLTDTGKGFNEGLLEAIKVISK